MHRGLRRRAVPVHPRRVAPARRAPGGDGVDLVLHVRAWPLELVNGAPLDPDLIADEVAQLRARSPRTSSRASTRASSGFVASRARSRCAAYERDVRIGERVSLLLRDALFEQGRDISRPDELARIADLAGVPRVAGLADRRALVLDDWQEGQHRGVIGSPHFFVGDTSFFCPSLDIRAPRRQGADDVRRGGVRRVHAAGSSHRGPLTGRLVGGPISGVRRLAGVDEVLRDVAELLVQVLGGAAEDVERLLRARRARAP